MVIHTDSFANERRFVCILKCRRTRQTRVVSGWMLRRCLKGNYPWVTHMWASHLLGPHVMDTKAGALRHRSIVLSGWSRVSDGRVAPSHPPLPPKKGRRQYKFALPRFGLKYLAAPIPALQNLSSPPSPSAPRLLKSLIRRQPSNRPSSRLFPHRSPPLCRTTMTKTTVALHHRTGATSSTPSSTAPGGPPTTSAAATDVPHRHRVPPHQVRFTDAVSQLTGATSPSTSSHLRPPRPLGLHQWSRPPHRSAPLPLKICIRARPANASASPSTALK